jgi:hypothetical protein
MDSTHFKDFRDTLFVIFGQAFYFLSILQVAAEIWNLKFEFKIVLTGLTGADEGAGDVAASYRPVPIRYEILILAIGSGLKELKRKGEGWTHRRSSPAR